MDRCDVLTFSGITSMVVGIGLFSLPAAIIVAGAALTALGILDARRPRGSGTAATGG